MNLFNTKTQQISPFKPDEKVVTVHACAAAGESDLSLNQVVTCCTADILVRYLRMQGHQVSLTVALAGEALAGKDQPNDLVATLQTLHISPPANISLNENKQPGMIETDILVTTPHSHPENADTILAGCCLETAVPQTEQPISLTQLLQTYSAHTLRTCLLQHHYRQPWTFDEVMLQKADLFVEKLKAAMNVRSTGEQPINMTPVQKRFTAVMNNDLDTSKALATLLNLADEILFRAPNGYRVTNAQSDLQHMAAVFGVYLDAETAVPEEMATGWNHLRQQLEERET